MLRVLREAVHGWPIEFAGGFSAYWLHVIHHRLFHAVIRLMPKGLRK